MATKDIIIIGGGAGGLSICSGAAQLGLSVTLIEREPNLGGDCLHYGCVPSKGLIHVADMIQASRDAQAMGFDVTVGDINLAKANDYVRSVIAGIQPHDDPERFRSYGANVIFGEAQFVDSHTVKVNEQLIKGRYIVVATGSRPMVPPIPGLNDIDYLTNETIFNCQQLPKRLAVLGGGAIGCELAQAMRRLGSEVFIVEMAPQLLSGMDEAISAALAEQLQSEGIELHLGRKLEQVAQADRVQLLLDDGTALDADKVLVAAGRAPNLDLNLDAAGVNYQPGGIEVDQRLRSSQKHIFAIGDAMLSRSKFTHMAEHHAGVVISNICFKLPRKVNHTAVPAVVYTNPECAQVGMTEQEAKLHGLRYEVSEVAFSEIDRARCENATAGFCKVLIHRGRIIGASLMRHHAGELVAELGLAIQNKLKLRQVVETIHAYPTLAQVNRRVVSQYYAPKLFSDRTRTIVKWLNRIF